MVLARFYFDFKACHLCKSFVAISKNYFIFVPCGNAGHTAYHQQRIHASGGLGGLQKSVLSITFASRWKETLQISPTCVYARNVATNAISSCKK
jgi:hypothetical protein